MLSTLYTLLALNMVDNNENLNETFKNFYDNVFLKLVWLIISLIIIKSVYTEDQINYGIDQVYNIVHPYFYFFIIACTVTFYGLLIIGGMCFTEPLH